jgi:superfamily II DNA or RNA helicase
MSDLFDQPLTRANIIPREYQVTAHDQTFALWAEGTKGVLQRIFTGGGKTLLACLIADTWLRRGDNHRVMVVSYETELVWQFAQEIEDYLGITPGIEMEAESVRADFLPPIVVASRQTLLRVAPVEQPQIDELASYGIKEVGALPKRGAATYLRYLRKGGDPDAIREEIQFLNTQPEACGSVWSRIHKFDWKLNWLVIFDEAHRHAYKLTSVGHLVDWFDQNPNSCRTGLTATPKRGDGTSVGDVMFPGVAIDYPLYSPVKACAVKDGYAVPYIQRYIEVEGVDFKQIKRASDGDFDQAALEVALAEEGQLAKLVGPLLDMVGERRTLIFSPGVSMAKAVALFINARVKAKCECGLTRWYPKALIGDGAECSCGRFVQENQVVDYKDQAEELDGTAPQLRRKEVYAGHKKGLFQFLSVCGLCLAKGTLILTDHGEVAIEEVTTTMKLWDGIEFVSHDGVIAKGVQPITRYAGLTATGDHHVWTDNGWERFAACKQRGIAIRVSAIGGKAVRESCGYYRDNHSTWEEPAGWFGGLVRRLREYLHQVLQRVEVWACRLQTMCEVVRCPELVADALPISKETVRKSERRILPGLRRTRHQVPVCFPDGNGSMDHGKLGSASGVDLRSQGQQPALRARQSSLGQSEGTSQQQATAPTGIQEEVEVYDILNAGPRHRFTANGLIVSNCREGYNDPDIACVAVFRPVSKKASSLAEQMKGRSCRPLRDVAKVLHTLPDAEARCKAIAESAKPNALIVDLVGITGLADCASTVEIYAEGLPDKVKERTEEILAEQSVDEEVNVEGAIEQAKREAEETKERIRKEREEAERKAREEFEKRAKLDAQSRYTAHDMGQGSAVKGRISEGQLKLIAALGMKLLRPDISTKQAHRIIDQLRSGMNFPEVARQNRLGEDWEQVKPSDQQIRFFRRAGLDVSLVKTKYDARQLGDAYDNPAAWVTRKISEMSKAYTLDELHAIGLDIRVAKSALTPELIARLATAGLQRKDAILGRGDAWEGD